MLPSRCGPRSRRGRHAYPPGTYTVTLRAVSSAGTSTARVFTGRTMSRNGGPSAETTLTLRVDVGAVPTAPPRVATPRFTG